MYSSMWVWVCARRNTHSNIYIWWCFKSPQSKQIIKNTHTHTYTCTVIFLFTFPHLPFVIACAVKRHVRINIMYYRMYHTSGFIFVKFIINNSYETRKNGGKHQFQIVPCFVNFLFFAILIKIYKISKGHKFPKKIERKHKNEIWAFPSSTEPKK